MRLPDCTKPPPCALFFLFLFRQVVKIGSRRDSLWLSKSNSYRYSNSGRHELGCVFLTNSAVKQDGIQCAILQIIPVSSLYLQKDIWRWGFDGFHGLELIFSSGDFDAADTAGKAHRRRLLVQLQTIVLIVK